MRADTGSVPSAGRLQQWLVRRAFSPGAAAPGLAPGGLDGDATP